MLWLTISQKISQEFDGNGHYKNGFSKTKLMHSMSSMSVSSCDFGFFHEQDHDRAEENRSAGTFHKSNLKYNLQVN